MQEPSEPFVVAFVAGVSPDKWSKRWRERYPEAPLELTLVGDSEQRAVLEQRRASLSFVRLPVERDGLHVIPLYEEVSVAVVSVEDDLSLHEEIAVSDLAAHQLVTDPADLPAWAQVATVERLAYPPMSARDAVEVVAASEGTVAVLPMSVARLHHRKDVVARPLTDGPVHPVGIAWRCDDEDPRIETFIGIVRGRTAHSSRNAEAAQPKPAQPAKKAAAAKKGASAKRSPQPARKPAARKAPGQRGAAPRKRRGR